MTDQERWLVVVNLVGVHKPIRLTPHTSIFTGRKGWESKCGEYDIYGRPDVERGHRQYVFKDKKSADTFYKGAMAVFAALRDFME